MISLLAYDMISRDPPFHNAQWISNENAEDRKLHEVNFYFSIKLLYEITTLHCSHLPFVELTLFFAPVLFVQFISLCLMSEILEY